MMRKDLRIKEFNTIMSGKLKDKECLCPKQEWVTRMSKNIDEVKKEVSEFSLKLKSKLYKKINNN